MSVLRRGMVFDLLASDINYPVIYSEVINQNELTKPNNAGLPLIKATLLSLCTMFEQNVSQSFTDVDTEAKQWLDQSMLINA